MFLTIISLVGKVAFMLYNAGEHCTLPNIFSVLWEGLPLDLSIAALLAVPVWGVTAISLRYPKMPLRNILSPYLVLCVLYVVLVTAGDIVMYHHWKFKLDACIFNYMSSPGSAGASASVTYIVTCISSAVIVIVGAIVIAIRMTPKRILEEGRGVNRTNFLATGALLGFTVWGITGQRSSEASVFEFEPIVLNHAAVNTAGHMLHSLWIYQQAPDRQFRSMKDEDCDALMQDLYPEEMDDITDTLLTTTRPNVLTIQLESFGASFVETLGGAEGVTPELCRWMERGVNFTNAWSNSFRTDRGTVSALSGYLSYPTYSLMMEDDCLGNFPSLASTLAANGYTTDYLYGGNSENMNKRKYLLSSGFQNVWDISNIDVPQEERDAWGANDSISFQRLYSMLTKKKDSAWYFAYQSISSHEPWTVPYHKLDNEVYNAFAYTDHCLGSFLDRLSKTPLWENLVVIIFADHGSMYQLDYQHPTFFRMPLLMVGGAIKEPKSFGMFINQSDMVGTLLGQMQISRKDYPWSRNVLSKNYTYPFVYSTYPSGMLFADSTGVAMMDLQSGCVVYSDGEDGDSRVLRTKAILQRSYDKLKEINIEH
jgi:phosphoglycerol transferase MdoB-like AlkP superfamily enzyme